MLNQRGESNDETDAFVLSSFVPATSALQDVTVPSVALAIYNILYSEINHLYILKATTKIGNEKPVDALSTGNLFKTNSSPLGIFLVKHEIVDY